MANEIHVISCILLSNSSFNRNETKLCKNFELFKLRFHHFHVIVKSYIMIIDYASHSHFDELNECTKQMFSRSYSLRENDILTMCFWGHVNLMLFHISKIFNSLKISMCLIFENVEKFHFQLQPVPLHMVLNNTIYKRRYIRIVLRSLCIVCGSVYIEITVHLS